MFIKDVLEKGIDNRGKKLSSAGSIACSVYENVNDWFAETRPGYWFIIRLISDGRYEIPKGLN